MFTSSDEDVQGLLAIVHLNTYDEPAIPVNRLFGLFGEMMLPPAPPIILQVPIPIVGGLAERVAVVKPT